jgi:hypothetical protein
MAGTFADRLARARRSVDAAFAEDWIFRPMARPVGPNAAAVPDPDRAIVDPFVAIQRETPADAFSTGRVASFSPTPSAGSIHTASYVVADGVDVRQGDRLENKASGLVYSVSRPQPYGRGRMTVTLTLAR